MASAPMRKPPGTASWRRMTVVASSKSWSLSRVVARAKVISGWAYLRTGLQACILYLKPPPELLVPGVVVAGVAVLQPRHAFHQIWLGSVERKVIVVVHEDSSAHFPTQAPGELSERSEEPGLVGVSGEKISAKLLLQE
ncbi:hypothetical protein OAF27_00945 [Verrucomicrobiales bacterium]|nr:hypothetical protein [Verrucomicrobiales bacterium]